MFQGDRVILKGRVEVGLGGMAGVARLREKRQIRQLQVRDDPGHAIDHGEIGLPLQIGMGEHQADEQHADTRQGQGRGSIFSGKSSPALFFRKTSV